jgi:hypothetical protein
MSTVPADLAGKRPATRTYPAVRGGPKPSRVVGFFLFMFTLAALAGLLLAPTTA